MQRSGAEQGQCLEAVTSQTSSKNGEEGQNGWHQVNKAEGMNSGGWQGPGYIVPASMGDYIVCV